MSFELQRTFDFQAAERPVDGSPEIKGTAEPVGAGSAVAEIAEALRPRVLAYLRKAEQPVGIRELLTELGHSGLDTDPDPQGNPVHYILKQMRDRGELICNEPEWGEPTFTLPVVEAAELKGNELAKRQLLIAAAWQQPIRITGPDDLASRFAQLARYFGLSIAEGNDAAAITIETMAPAQRELESQLPGTSTGMITQQLAGMADEAPANTDRNARILLDAAAGEFDLAGAMQQSVMSLAGTIARVDNAGSISVAHVAEAINYLIEQSKPLENPIPAAPPLVRPDRQCTFDGVPHYDWPKPEEDRDSITVDRIHDDIDGQSHRFLIRRCDSVEVFFRRDKVNCGEVVGISHARREVRVRFGDRGEGIWFAVGQIYPTPEEQLAGPTVPPLSTVAGDDATQPPGGSTDRVDSERAERSTSPDSPRESAWEGMDALADQRPYSLHKFRAYRDRLDAGDASLAEHQAEFAHLRAARDAFITDLTKQSDAARLKILAARFGCVDAKRNTKRKNAEHVYRALLQSFVLGGSVQFNPMQETMEEAVVRSVDGLTDDTWRAYHEKVAAERADREQALSNPQTLEQFRLVIRERGLKSLSDEQRIRFDELSADSSRAARKAKVTETVMKIDREGIDSLEFSIKEGWHDKKECKLWIVQLSERVERDVYRELLRKAKMLGGWFSSFKKSDAGFQFMDEDRATRFASLLEGDVDRADVLADRKARKMSSAGERLADVAETLASEADEILDADAGKLKNTVRRSEMAAGMRGRAYAARAMAGTLRSIAAALDAGGAQYLDGVRAATHVDTLIGLLRRAKTKRNVELLKDRGELGVWDRHNASEELSKRPPEHADVAFAAYPYLAIYRRHLEELMALARNTSGLKQLSRRLDSFLVTDRENHFVDFVDDSDIAFLQDYVARCKRVRLETRWVEHGMEDWKRLRAANIFTPQELRCSLRELLPHLTIRDADDPVQLAEAKLIGMKLPGFFPTPRPVISRMLELAQIKDGDRVLEPSAGKGDILDMIREQHPEASVTAVELNGTLFDVLDAKGHDVTHMDFLIEYAGEHDVIVMNPPFAGLQDIAHVQHAYKQLAPGGRLVSVMSAGPFFRSDRNAVEFRAWLEQVGGEVEDLPEDAFRGVEAFRQTGVRTKLVFLSHPA